MNDARLLVVGREDGVARGWVDQLRDAGANIAVVTDGVGALRHLESIEPEIILLDLQLGGQLDGFDTCRAIRSRSPAIVVIAARSPGAYDELVALAVGADHFLPAETEAEVVVARLRSLVRRARGAVLVDAVVGAQGALTSAGGAGGARGRSVQRPGRSAQGLPAQGLPAQRSAAPANGAHRNAAALNGSGNHSGPARQLAFTNALGHDGAAERIVDGDLEIDLVAREVRVGGAPTALTRIEFDLLVTLARHPRRVFTREQLMASAWEEPFDGSHVLDAHLSRLRMKVVKAGGERVAHAVRGVGYRLRA